MRGFNYFINKRAKRAGTHYFDDDTLRGFDAYCCAYGSLLASLDPDNRVITFVDSIRQPASLYSDEPRPAREYRAMVLHFTGELHRERVSVEKITGTHYLTARPAEREMREFLARVATRVEGGEDLDAVVSEEVAR